MRPDLHGDIGGSPDGRARSAGKFPAHNLDTSVFLANRSADL